MNNLPEPIKILNRKNEAIQFCISQDQNDMKSLQEKPSIFLAAVGNVTLGPNVDSKIVPKANFGSRICKFSECKEKTNIKRMQETLRNNREHFCIPCI